MTAVLIATVTYQYRQFAPRRVWWVDPCVLRCDCRRVACDEVINVWRALCPAMFDNPDPERRDVWVQDHDRLELVRDGKTRVRLPQVVMDNLDGICTAMGAVVSFEHFLTVVKNVIVPLLIETAL